MKHLRGLRSALLPKESSKPKPKTKPKKGGKK